MAGSSRDAVDRVDRAADHFDPSELSPFSEWREISDGGYSEVYKARLLGATVAVKQATSRKKTSGEALLREIRYLRMAGPHPNLVQAYGAFVEAGRLNLVMEFARHSLRQDRVARSADPVLVLAGVARALVRLHSLSIVHRDLKARNVLVAADNRALLIDFGLACHVYHDSAEWVGRTVGTKKYRPPEMRDKVAAQPSMDVYCFGLMVDKLLRQRERGSSEESGRSELGRHERRDCLLLQQLADECTSRDPRDRPHAWSLLARLQRHVGEETARCDARRERVPLLTAQPTAALLHHPHAAPPAATSYAGPSEPPPPPGARRKRKRGRGDADDGSGPGDGVRARSRSRSRSRSSSRS